MARPPVPPKALRELWAKIPSVECKGRCSNSCGPIECSTLERRLIEERAGRKLEARPPDMDCSMLRNGYCTLHSIRPVICRLWGVVESMPCPHGCKPERVLSDREGLTLMVEAMELAGDNAQVMMREFLEQLPEDTLAKMREWTLGAPDLGGALRNRPKAREEFERALGRI